MIAAPVPATFLARTLSHELSFTLKQPLLRGAGARIDTAPLRIARVEEEIAVLALKQTVIDIVFSVVRSYRDVMQAERRVDIRVRSLARARELLTVNELLVQTGRMAERDIVQTKADIAGREIQSIAARNALDATRLALTDILDVAGRPEIRLADTLADIRDAKPPQSGSTQRWKRRPEPAGFLVRSSESGTRELGWRSRKTP